VAEVPLRHLVFAGEHVAVSFLGVDVLEDPFIEIAGTNRQAVLIEDCRHAHRRLSAIAQPVKCHAARIDEGEIRQQSSGHVMLRNDEGKKGEAEWIGAPLQNAKVVLP
jgi:hypothetical protein